MKPSVAPILSLRIPVLSRKEAYRRLEDMLQQKSAARVYTPNPQMALRAALSPALSRMLGRASLLLPDGVGLVIASRLLGTPLPARITGIDTAEYLLRVAESKGLSVALLGARPGVAEKAARRLRQRYPRLRTVFCHHGYFEKSGKENEAVLRALRRVEPDILFVCFGFPAQEIWIDRHAASIPSLRLCLGLGGALDVFAGQTRRAPNALCAVGLEWLWRTLSDPKRYRNFVEIPLFLLLVLRQKKKRRLANPPL